MTRMHTHLLFLSPLGWQMQASTFACGSTSPPRTVYRVPHRTVRPTLPHEAQSRTWYTHPPLQPDVCIARNGIGGAACHFPVAHPQLRLVRLCTPMSLHLSPITPNNSPNLIRVVGVSTTLPPSWHMARQSFAIYPPSQQTMRPTPIAARC
ncbi:unnamed protein product [Periconia digitata]|uniref:Secreted protein n=1 Tax=Periconia digitata TaxID=1303443 RepID=A0A9W4U2A8_9PLEO|nr:unnamed protein product [Periconia digitata]